MYSYMIFKRKKISNLNVASRNFSQKNLIISYLLPFKFERCEGKENLIKKLFDNTFILKKGDFNEN